MEELVVADSRPNETNAPTVVLLHGLLLNSEVWDPLLPLLREVRVLTIDLPGHGAAPALPQMSLDAVTDAIARAIGSRGVNRALVVGSSLGAIVTAELAHRHTALLRGGILLGAFGHATAEPGPFRDAMATFVRTLETDAPAAVRGAVPSWLGPLAGRAAAGWLLRMTRGTDIPAAARMGLDVLGWDPRPWLGAVDVPLHWVLGDHDSIPADVVRQDAAMGTRSTFSTLTHSGHLPQVETPCRVADLIEQALMA